MREREKERMELEHWERIWQRQRSQATTTSAKRCSTWYDRFVYPERVRRDWDHTSWDFQSSIRGKVTFFFFVCVEYTYIFFHYFFLSYSNFWCEYIFFVWNKNNILKIKYNISITKKERKYYNISYIDQYVVGCVPVYELALNNSDVFFLLAC